MLFILIYHSFWNTETFFLPMWVYAQTINLSIVFWRMSKSIHTWLCLLSFRFFACNLIWWFIWRLVYRNANKNLKVSNLGWVVYRNTFEKLGRLNFSLDLQKRFSRLNFSLDHNIVIYWMWTILMVNCGRFNGKKAIWTILKNMKQIKIRKSWNGKWSWN